MSSKQILTRGLVVSALFLCGTSFAGSGARHPQPGDDRGAFRQVQPGDDKGKREAQPGDDQGRQAQPGEDRHALREVQKNDDKGKHEVQPGDDKGKREAQPGDDHRGNLAREAQPNDDRGRQPQPKDDRGRHPQPGDDRGAMREIQPGDDRGRDGTGNNNNGNNGAPGIRVRIALMGTLINGRLPQGHAEFRTESGRVGLRVEAENVNLPNGTPLLVSVNGAPVGMLTLIAGQAELELRSQNGDAVPPIGKGSMITVTASNGALTMTVLAGQF